LLDLAKPLDADLVPLVCGIGVVEAPAFVELKLKPVCAAREAMIG